MEKKKYNIGEKVRLQLTTIKGEGERHFGVIENIVPDMFNGTEIFLVRVLDNVFAVPADAMELLKRGKNKKPIK